ncbi:site-specific DNA-methyltransferase [Tersicoccus sp. MR15.9]|uniref:site-specific DNA-methyltransferase n=1 Tax=Tersicoccus mangrovi TaxID=3121635 RepID=UPI002FE5B3A9
MNLLLVGDARTALTDPALTGVAKLAYLDPPYNTGKRFTQYNDTAPLARWLGMLEDVFTGVHGALAEDGSIWVHVDDTYVHRVRVLLDDVFGPANYVNTVVWEKKNRASFLNAHIASVTDQILVYAKDRTRLAPFVHTATAVGKRIPVHNKANKPSQLSFPAGCMSFNFPDTTVPAGPMNTATITSALLDDVVIENGVNVNAFRMTGPFRYGQEAIEKMAASPGAFVCPRPMMRPSYLSQEARGKVLTNLQSFRVNGSPTNEDARAESEALFGHGTDFDTPKPEGLLERIIGAATAPGDTVLDAFAGSGTTAAVAQKMGRSWIAVEQSPETAARFIGPRIDGILAGSDPLPLPGYTASAEGYEVIETADELPGAESAA